MPRDGNLTREKILDAAQALILERGYSGMTVDSVLDRVGITKGAFFYHFKTKDDLGKSLLQRYDTADTEVYDSTRTRAEKLSSDPIQQVLIFIGLFEEMFEDLTEPYPGCLFASYIYELQQFDDETRELIHRSFLRWRTMLVERLQNVLRVYTLRNEIDTRDLADAFTVVIEGAFITSKALDDPGLISRQLRLFRNHLELLFSGATPRQDQGDR